METEEVLSRTDEIDENHAIIAALREEINALKNEKRKQSEPVKVGDVIQHLGGAPVPHHLHLVDGRVIADHEGIGTHYSETLEDGTERVTRVRAHYPVNEIHPNEKFQ
jgi:hypothetical protein